MAFGLIGETVDLLGKESAGLTAVTIIGAIVLTWDIIKDKAGETINKLERRALFRIRRTQHLLLPNSPDLQVSDILEIVKDYADQRYPRGSGYRVRQIDDPDMPSIRVRRNLMCHLDIGLAQFRKANEQRPQLRLTITRDTIYDVACRVVLVVVLFANVVECSMHNPLYSADGLTLFVAIPGLVIIAIVFVLVKTSANWWFPISQLTSLRDDISEILARAGTAVGLKTQLHEVAIALADEHRQRALTFRDRLFAGLRRLLLYTSPALLIALTAIIVKIVQR